MTSCSILPPSNVPFPKNLLLSFTETSAPTLHPSARAAQLLWTVLGVLAAQTAGVSGEQRGPGVFFFECPGVSKSQAFGVDGQVGSVSSAILRLLC